MLNLDSIFYNRYRIDRLHELGAVETIYLGWDNLSNQAVTISETKAQPNLTSDSLEALKAQFAQQAQILCALNHKNLIAPSDSFVIDAVAETDQPNSEDGSPVPHSYVVTPVIGNDSLMQRINDQGPLPEKSVILWAGQILDALVYCHHRHVLHGDIRPQNVYITPEGNAVLAHFEVPSLWNTADPRKWTAKRVLGTPDYAPPERWVMRVGQIDERSDIYSLGATLLHALTGKLPISAEERIANPYNFQNIEFANIKVSLQVKHILTHAMAVPKDKRYSSAAAMATDLHASESISKLYNKTPAIPLLFLPTRFKKISWLKIGGLILSSIVLFFSGLLGLWLHSKVPPVTTWFSQPASPTVISTVIPPTPKVLIEVLPASPTLPPTTSIPTITPEQPATVQLPELTSIMSDTFDSNTYQWPISNSQDEWGSIVREITGGHYVWHVGAEKDVGRWCLPDSDSYATDFRLSVDTRRLSGPLNIAYGLIIRHNEGRYYVFNTRDDGYFRFSLWQGYEWITIIDWTETLSIRPGEMNKLEVITRGPVFEFY
ncbi:MAG: serine/threonine protein kinase, partial [Anaerolineales bacterium]